MPIMTNAGYAPAICARLCSNVNFLRCVSLKFKSMILLNDISGIIIALYMAVDVVLKQIIGEVDLTFSCKIFENSHLAIV